MQIGIRAPTLIIVLCVGLLNGLIFTFLIPPWQHYDEPSHFEYAWLISTNKRIPQSGDYNQTMRREVAASMIESDFFKGNSTHPNLLALTAPVWIGLSQLSDPPLYYLYVSLPLFFSAGLDVVTQLYMTRLASLILYLITVLMSFWIIREIAPHNHLLQWTVPICLAILPAFIDVMTAVNNDVGATVVFTLFLWQGVRILTRGATIARWIAMTVITVLAVFTKNTIWVAIPLVVILGSVVVFKRFNRQRTLLLIGSLVGVGIGVIFFLSWDDASQWYRHYLSYPALLPSRAIRSESPVGKHVLHISVPSPDNQMEVIYQPINSRAAQKLSGRIATVGAWIWAEQPELINAIGLYLDGEYFSKKVEITNKPQFFAFHQRIPARTQNIQIIIDPGRLPLTTPVSVFVDGLVFLKGRWPEDSAPIFDDDFGKNGIWGGRTFENLASNPSFESSWISINPRIGSLISTQTPLQVVEVLAVAQDYQSLGWVVRQSLTNLFQSYWARFGWNHVRLTGSWYLILAVCSLIGVFGFILRTKYHYPLATRMELSAIWWLMIAGALIWIAALLRTEFPVIWKPMFLSGARYAYPAVVPSMFVLVSGISFLLERSPLRKYGNQMIILGLAVLNVHSLLTIYRFYY